MIECCDTIYVSKRTPRDCESLHIVMMEEGGSFVKARYGIIPG